MSRAAAMTRSLRPPMSLSAPRAALAALLAGALASAAHADPAPVRSKTALAAVDTQGSPAARGGRTYGHYCAVCHGANADGNGRAAPLHNPRPANLRTSDKNDTYMALIVRRGGAALGRSASMPPWSEELNEQQIDEIVAFIRSVNTHVSTHK